VQPCGDNVPVIVELENDGHWEAPANHCRWGFEKVDMETNIKSWKPDLEALIEMQNEHDKQLITKAKINKIWQPEVAVDVGQSKPTYTAEMKSINKLPEVGMLAVICHASDPKITAEIAYLSSETVVVKVPGGEDVFSLEQTTFEPVDTRTEPEIACKKQRDAIIVDCQNGFQDGSGATLEETIEFLQDRNWLAEIILPLKD
jgi:hypothetical protein